MGFSPCGRLELLCRLVLLRGRYVIPDGEALRSFWLLFLKLEVLREDSKAGIIERRKRMALLAQLILAGRPGEMTIVSEKVENNATRARRREVLGPCRLGLNALRLPQEIFGGRLDASHGPPPRRPPPVLQHEQLQTI